MPRVNGCLQQHPAGAGLLWGRYARHSWCGFRRGLIGINNPVTTYTEKVMTAGDFRHNRETILRLYQACLICLRAPAMRFLIAALLGTASFLSPLGGFAQSSDVEATIQSVDINDLTLTLDDGKTYRVPEEFNFEGLESGVKVLVFYTEVDGSRVVDDLEIVQ